MSTPLFNTWMLLVHTLSPHLAVVHTPSIPVHTCGQVPPFVIVGIDNPGPMRSLNYLPYAPGRWVRACMCEVWGEGVWGPMRSLNYLPYAPGRWVRACMCEVWGGGGVGTDEVAQLPPLRPREVGARLYE